MNWTTCFNQSNMPIKAVEGHYQKSQKKLKSSLTFGRGGEDGEPSIGLDPRAQHSEQRTLEEAYAS
jgi:hypothetical protein